MTVEEIKKIIAGGQWQSIAPEIRPSSIKNADGSLKPFYLTRKFTYHPGDKFQLEIINLADPYGKVPLAKLVIQGHMKWIGEHPIAPGAYKVDFIADEGYEVTPLLQGFADVLNQLASQGYNKWQVNGMQRILKKPFPPFGLGDGQVFSEYDLIYVYNNMLFWGARNVDGRSFDKEENRPTNLQIPLIKM
jgi:hypothetical protein